jgi:hypothetical protein
MMVLVALATMGCAPEFECRGTELACFCDDGEALAAFCSEEYEEGSRIYYAECRDGDPVPCREGYVYACPGCDRRD